ncbi:hypothetical protein NDI39_13310 [Microcoleus sp. ZQ-A2]|nr:hypothetical protein [Microcoleus sp. FACHB-1]
MGVYRRTNPEPAVLPTAGLSHLKSERMTDDNHSQENVCALTFNLHLRLLESLGEPLLVNQTLIYGVKVQNSNDQERLPQGIKPKSVKISGQAARRLSCFKDDQGETKKMLALVSVLVSGYLIYDSSRMDEYFDALSPCGHRECDRSTVSVTRGEDTFSD